MFKTLIALAVAATLCVFVVPAIAHAEPMEPASFSEVAVDPIELSAPAPSSAYAQPTVFVPDGNADIPLGEILVAIFGSIGTALAAWLSATLNAYFNKKGDAERAAMIATWTARAVSAAANYVEGAAPGLKVSFKVGSEWVERALEQSLALFPDLIAANGGEAAQRRRLWSYIELEAHESVPVAAPVQIQPVKAATPPGEV